MARPKRQPGQIETRERILTAAERAFAERGFDGAPLESIAARAGIRRPSLLYYFPTKQALYSAVIEAVFSDLRQVLFEALSTDGSFEDRLDAVVKSFDAHVNDRPQAAQLILREILDDRGPGHDLLLTHAVPVIEMVEAFIQDSAEAHLAGLSAREAVMAVACSRFVRAAAGRLSGPLWGPDCRTDALARKLFTASG